MQGIKKLFSRAAAYGRKHSFLLPAVMAFACFIIVVLLVISVWFTTSISKNLENSVYQIAVQQSETSAETLRLTLDGLSSLGGWISNETAIAPRSYQANPYKAYATFKQYDIHAFRCSNVMLYYGADQMLLSVFGTLWPEVCFSAVTDLDALLHSLDAVSGKQLLCTADYGAPRQQNTLILAQRLSNHALALFTLDYLDLYELIAPGIHFLSKDTSLRLIVTDQGNPLWMNADLDPTALSTIQNSCGSRLLMLNNRSYLCSVSDVSHGAKLITLDVVTNQFEVVSIAVRMLVAVCVVLLITGVLLLVLGMQRSGAPIAQLVSTVRESLPFHSEVPENVMDALRQVCSQYSRLVHESTQHNALLSDEKLRDLFVLRILCGQYANGEELEHLCEWLNIELPHSCFASCLMLFEQPPSEQERLLLETRLRSLSDANFSCYFCLTPDGCSSVGLLNFDDPARLSSIGEALQQKLLDYASVTIGIGDVYQDINMLGRSYLEAHAALERRLILGKNSCIFYREARIDNDSIAPYPQEMLDAYAVCLRSWDAVAIQEELDRLILFIQENEPPLQQVKCICFELTASLLREINRMGSLASKMNIVMTDVFSIAEYASVNELAANIVSLSQSVQEHVESRKNRRKDNLIVQCQQCIQENVSNPQFSLGLLAEQFDVTPQTLRRNFKEATGVTLSNYLIMLRIERAKQLLVETDLDLNSICVQCGYIDVSSFARLFKSEVGVSPGAYREDHREHF